MDLVALKKEARSKQISAARLIALSKIASELSRYIAKLPYLPSEVMDYLLHPPNVNTVRSIAANKTTPVPVLEYLSGHGSWTILKTVADNINTPPIILDRLAKHRQHTVRKAAASNPSLLQSTIDSLTDDTNEFVLMSLLTRQLRRIPVSLQEKLATSEHRRVRNHVFRYGQLPQVSREKLIRDEKVDISLQDLEDATPELLDHLSKSQLDGLRRCVAIAGNTSPATLEALSYDESWEVREEVAFNSNTSLNTLRRLTTDASIEVRRKLAANPKLTEEILDVLSHDSYHEVRSWVIIHPAVSSPTLKTLTRDPKEKIRSLAQYKLARQRQEKEP